MKKVLILTNSIDGLYSFRKELMQKLIEERYEVIISSPQGDKVSYFKSIGCKYIETNVDRRGLNPLNDLKLLLNYKKIVKSNKPRVVLTYTIKPNVYGGVVCRLLNVPQIANITGLGTAVEKKGLLQTISLFLYRISLKKAQCVFFQNKENQEFLISKKVAVNNNRLIPGSGVNLQRFYLMEYPEGDILRFIFIGRVMKEKGIDQYLKAAQYIKTNYPNTEFHIIGNCEENYLEKLRKMEEEGLVIYHGRQDDVREFHKFSHCTIHPTYYPEGMSNVLLESAACGRPIITTNRSGCREIVDNEENGYLVEQQNANDLIKKVEAFIYLDHNTKIEMGLKSRKKVEKEFDRRIVVNAYLQEINR
ncbi:glycosyltransferase family 4 protein [Evansella halocellulosilytica]|uniref:glycosyltransferase family 4 protein n=1 Tax=Evansella halocellulosilytica TaxID=2011013 RepID=UPI000BB83F2A|nr:glycosyltransferase family 4 protein [Evansella halocellulosilytica]